MVRQASDATRQVVRAHVERWRYLDTDRALAVGAPDLDAELIEDGENLGGRVAVAVVHPGADQPDARRDRGKEGWIRRRRTVVGHSQQFSVQQLGTDQQVGLCRQLHIPGQQHPPALVGDAQHEGGVVEFAP